METIVAAPCPLEIQAQMSPFSAPPEVSQPVLAFGSVIVSAYSWPPTIVTPSVAGLTPVPPVGMKLAPHAAPASLTYGMFVYGSCCPLAVVAECQAQYWVPKPRGVTPCGLSTM